MNYYDYSTYYNYTQTPDESFTGLIALAVLGIIYLAVFICVILDYVFRSIALHKIAKRREIAKPWLAWIPFANYWIIGRIADEYDAKNGIKRRWGRLLLVLSITTISVLIISLICLFYVMISMAVKSNIYDSTSVLYQYLPAFIIFYIITLISVIAASVLQFLSAICVYKIFESTNPVKAVKYMVLYILVPLAGGICLFLCRNKGYSNMPQLPPAEQNPQNYI